MENNTPLFRTEAGAAFPGISIEDYNALISELVNSYGVSYPQICESVSYSMAMVIRVALGLSAAEARVGVIASDSFPGWCALAAIRHLATAGAECFVILTDLRAAESEMMKLELKPLSKMQVNIQEWTSLQQEQELSAFFSGLHNVIWGVAGAGQEENPVAIYICEVLNELQTPVHCLQAPAGIDLNNGQRKKSPLFASSTLSLGIPLTGLHAGREFTGRHYLCDISISPQLYRTKGPNLTVIFSEQPVVQIFPVVEEK